MWKIYLLLILSVLIIKPFNTFSANIPKFSQSFLDTWWNQLILNYNGKISYITKKGNISSSASEKECLSYLKKNPKKTCISYQVIVPNYNNEFGIFIKTELSQQDLIWKTIFRYSFSSKSITNIQESLPKDLQNVWNFWMWYAGDMIYYTQWRSSKFTQPQSMSPSLFIQ